MFCRPIDLHTIQYFIYIFFVILDRRDGSVDNYNSRNDQTSRNNYNYGDRGSRGGNSNGGYRSGGGNQRERRSNDTRTKQTGHTDYDNYREPSATTVNISNAENGGGGGDTQTRERTSIDRDSNSSTEGANNRRRRKAKNNYSHNASK